MSIPRPPVISTVREALRGARPWWFAVGALAVYLIQPGQRSGDGAAYVLQAIDGPLFDRAVHAGWLLPLTGIVRGLDRFGVPPSLAANLAALAVGALILALLKRLAADLRGRDGLETLLAPGVALGAAATWDAGLFCEVYGPLTAALLTTALALRRGQAWGAGAAAFLAFAIHPGALFLLPGVCLASGARRHGVGLAMGFASILALGWITILGVEPFLGARGALALPDVTVWQSLQRAARLLTRDLGLASAPLLLGALIAARTPQGRRWLLGSLAVLCGAALGLDRFSDNPGQLATLLLLCPLAPFCVDVGPWLPDPSARRIARAALLGVVILGIAESSSRHDATARRAQQEDEALRADCAIEGARWAEEMRRRLVCRGGDPPASDTAPASSASDR